ncbi:MAG TPA: hypothetical protein PLL09_04685 [Flavobacterium sp.]|uniref:hypothetical protein n=1 Tax=unclassified Flavobacterium TaxID=196869 RepID=UPI0025C4C145|nr:MULTISPECIES: hypothetical protein [unclassified Flavobacterium]HRE77105.1 hypothetical protein [Flavobacterium sp.]
MKKLGRPFKQDNWIKELENVLNNENILFLSDSDLVFLVNKNLDEADRICKSTFEKWKAGKHHKDDVAGEKFIELVHHALIKQKQFLSKKMIDDDKNWQRYAWIMERKFAEWNLKRISENINRNEQSAIIQITASTDEQAKLIDNIINIDFEEIKPIRIPISSDDNKDENYDF